MSVKVDPAQLYGYASQLERNGDFLVAPLREYCGAQCGRTDGGGLVALGRPIVDLTVDVTTDLLSSGQRNLFQVAVNLRAAADRYRAGDLAAAERIWLVLPRRSAPEGYLDRNDDRHPGDYRDPFAPRPAPPPEHAEFDGSIEEARHHIGVIDDMLERYVHFSLAEQVLPWISGDWGTLRENADGYAALAGADGVQALRHNLGYGLDSLSASWDSPAATQFAFLIRDRWLPALDALQHVFEMFEEAFEAVAQNVEMLFKTLVLAVEVLKFWVVEKVLRIMKIIGSVLKAGKVWDEIMDLLRHVVHFWHEIKMLFELIRLMFKSVHEWVQFAGAQAKVIEETWLAPEDRLNPITVG